MDLSINLEDYKLNIRAGHYALIGGRVELGEDSETTKRNFQYTK